MIEYVNTRFTEVTGYMPEEVLGEDSRVLNPDFRDSRVYEKIQTMLDSGHSWKGNIQTRRKNGELYWERLSISPIVDEDRQTINYLAIGEDITNEVRMYRKLAESEKASVIGLLAAGVAHEFKNYLCSIMGNASYTLDDLDNKIKTSKVRKILSTIIDIAEQADRVARRYCHIPRQAPIIT